VSNHLELFSGKRVLIVEDEYLIAQDTRRALEKAGAIVIGPASNVDDGLELVRSQKIDAAILDINLDGDMVYPIADLLDEMSIPFVFATGYSPSQIPGKYSGYVLCEKPTELGYIALALFDPNHGLH
jgi:CheY-like chemotaxis protein